MKKHSLNTRLIISLVLITVFSKSFAESPMPESGPTLKIIQYDLSDKDFKVEVGYTQGIDKVETLKDKIKMIPLISPAGTEDYKSHISSAYVCLVKKLSPNEFQNLRFAEVTGVSHIPSAETKPKYSGSSVTVGSDAVTLHVTAPSIGGTADSGFEFTSTIDTTVSDPHEKSDIQVNNNVLTDIDNILPLDFGKSMTSGMVMPFNFFVISMNIKSQTDPGAFRNLMPNQVVNEIIVSNGYGQKYDPDYYYGFSDGDTEGWMQSLEMGPYELGSVTNSSSSSSYVYSSKAAPKDLKVTDPKVELCWSTHNYESVTTQAPELIQPKLTLGFIK